MKVCYSFVGIDDVLCVLPGGVVPTAPDTSSDSVSSWNRGYPPLHTPLRRQLRLVEEEVEPDQVEDLEARA